MGSSTENKDVSCYFVTKHSWKGKYKRVFSVGTHGITTYTPASMDVTNQWLYSDVLSIMPNLKSLPSVNEFVCTVRKGKKLDTMRFSSEHRADIITDVLNYRHLFAELPKQLLMYTGYKHHWSGDRIPIGLVIKDNCIEQRDATSNTLLVAYDYKQIDKVCTVSDIPGGFVICSSGYGRLHLFSSAQSDEIAKKIVENAYNNIGINVGLSKNAIRMDDFNLNRLGKYSSDEAVTSMAEYIVQKITPRHEGPVKRILALTETCLVERDCATYNICSCRPLNEIYGLVRDQENPQMFTVEYVRGVVRSYISTDRDSLLASLLDGVRTAGNKDVNVKMVRTNRGHRLGPLTIPVDQEVESLHLKFLQQQPGSWSFHDAVSRFNANVSYSGLLHAVTSDGIFAENKERLIHGAVSALLDKEGDLASISLCELEAQFQAIRRLVASKSGFAAFTKLPSFRERMGVKVIKALKRNDVGVTHAAIDAICALMEPMHDDYDLRQEQLNKASLLSSKTFLENLMDMFAMHIIRGTGALVIASMLDLLTFALCAPYSETTDGTHFDQLLEIVAHHGRAVYKLFQHPSLAIVKGAGLLMKAIIEEGEQDIATKMQDLSLTEGAVLKHLHVALFTQSYDSRMLTNRQISRHLIGLWVTGHEMAMSLLRRVLPGGLLVALESDEKAPKKEADLMHIRDNLKLAQDHQNKNRKNPQWAVIEKHLDTAMKHWRERVGWDFRKENIQERPIVLRKRRERIKSKANWLLFYYKFQQDHSQPNLLWNFKTREELRESLEAEIRGLAMDRDLCASGYGSEPPGISWNHAEFEVYYPSLSEEVKIGDYFLRLLLEKGEKNSVGVDHDDLFINNPGEFFSDVYHRFLLTPKTNMKSLCLQSLAIVYAKHHEQIGAFNDTKYIVMMLERCNDKLERDRLVLLLDKLVLNKKNVKELIDVQGLKVLVDLLTLAHLHVSRATVPMQTNVLEGAAMSEAETVKEWYYGNAEKERFGPFSFQEIKELYVAGKIDGKTRCWAQGSDGWRPVCSIPQLKWTLFATGHSVLNESELATVILDMLVRMCEFFPSRDPDGNVIRPLPKCKRVLSDASVIPHIVQLLLTFDPFLVEKVARVLFLVMQDNPNISQVYLTGAFYFILMYTGSNLLPVARFLKLTHACQAFRIEENNVQNDIANKSILGQILPEAMLCYLDNYGPDRFAEIFLGEFDTPEVIWNADMRRLMIQKIALHISDFTPRFQSNTRALYQFCSIPHISYPQLDNELFCSSYYLRHMCDVVRFPDWPIRDPVKLLKDILVAWRVEVEKKPSTMTVEECYDVLGLKKGAATDDAAIRKAYFRLAQKYHPDKNPDGREMFEQVNRSYEYLCSKSSKAPNGPDPHNIVLILRAQSILLSRYKDVLEPYKYAGYPQLVKTIKMETDDEQLFSKSEMLLSAATELAYHTVNCSALNAEEMRRERGLEILLEAFSRCVSMLSRSSKDEDVAVQVTMHCVRFFTVAGQFPMSLEKMSEMPTLVTDLCRTLFFSHLPRLCFVSSECVFALAASGLLQMSLLQSGVIWHLILFLFEYDFTLEEGGVEKNSSSNHQEVCNLLARESVCALARLGGFYSSTHKNSSPDNDVVKSALRALIGPYMCKQLAKDDQSIMLKLFTSNTENPYLIWDNRTRHELHEFVAAQQSSHVRSGESDIAFGAEFQFTTFSHELFVGDVFVRIYNEQPNFVLHDAKSFTIDLLCYLEDKAQYLHSLISLSNSKSSLRDDYSSLNGGVTDNCESEQVKNVRASLKALGNVIRNNSGVEIQCIGHFKLLFSLLRMDTCEAIQLLVLELLEIVTGNAECVNDIAASEVMGYFLLALHSIQSATQSILVILYALMSNTKLVKEAMAKGVALYLLDVFCSSPNSDSREKTAELLSKMCMDKLVGQPLKITLTKFLPAIFLDAMRDSPSAAVHMFEGVHENPELIWNEESRDKVKAVLAKLSRDLYRMQRDDPCAGWKIMEDMNIVYSQVQGELVVGGVYLRLFVANPTWVVRRPREFMRDLFDTCITLAMKDRPDMECLETVVKALVCLLQANPTLADALPTSGHLVRLTSLVTQQRNEQQLSLVAKPCILVLHQAALRDSCISSLSQNVDTVGAVLKSMRARPDLLDVGCETLHRLFGGGSTNEEFVKQAMSVDLVPYLLSLLENSLDSVSNPSSIKAQIVKALKAMTYSLQYGDQINALLDKCRVWADYKNQKHDLFISNTANSGYLTGAAPGVAGYLTQGSNRSIVHEVPPQTPSDMYNTTTTKDILF